MATVHVKQQFKTGGKAVTLYPGEEAGAPLVVLNTYTGDGSSVVASLESIGAPDCSLLVVGDLAWDHDMTPWHCDPLSKGDTPCTGGAQDYLGVLLDDILPQACACLSATPAFVGIAGYSLAGLFALWSAYHCDAFARVASMSGSLWFPGFVQYAGEREMRMRPERVYLSLGDREAKTRHPILRTVQDNTETLVELYRSQELDVIYELNPGNHFKQPALRSAKGIKALLA